MMPRSITPLKKRLSKKYMQAFGLLRYCLTRIEDVLVVKKKCFMPSLFLGGSIAFELGKPSSSTELITETLALSIRLPIVLLESLISYSPSHNAADQRPQTEWCAKPERSAHR
jgi:hypothetical protein